jgi:hypothetical protein
MRGGGSGQDADQGATRARRLPVPDAARALGISVDAVRARVKRDTLRTEREGGRVWVLLDADQDADQHSDQGTDQLLEALRDEIAHLRRESERKDTIIMSLSQSNAELSRTIRAIEAPETPESPVPNQTPTEASEEPETGAREPEPRSWWRRWFGA